MDEDTMRRLKVAALSAGLVGTLGLSSCSADQPEDVQTVYGPPTDSSEIEYVQAVYGPPSWSDEVLPAGETWGTQE